MPTARGPDGRIFRFPDDATPEEIQRAMQSAYERQAREQEARTDHADRVTTFGQRALAGAGGPIAQIAQFGEELLRRRAQSGEAERDFQRDEGILDRGGSLLERGYQSASGGLNRFVGTVTGSDVFKRRAREGEQVAQTDIAGTTSWEEAKKQGGLGGYLKFGAETAIQSLPEMAIVAAPVVGLPVEAAIQTGRIGQERAQNNDEYEATHGDLVKAAPAGIASAALERIGVKGVAGKFGSSAVGRVATGVATEGATEFAQSGIEYAGGTVGTEKGFDPSEALDQSLAGLVGGAVGGGVISTTVETGGQVVRKVGSRPTPAGVIEQNVEQAGNLTEEDRASPLPDDAIAGGRKTVAASAASPQADSILEQAGYPKTKQRVTITDTDGSTLSGVVEDAFATDQGSGIKVRLDDGSLFENHFDDLAEVGVTVTAQTAQQIDADLAQRAEQARARSDEALANVQVPVEQVQATAQPVEQAAPVVPVNDAIEGFKSKTRKVESGGNDAAKNPRSSASGRYQFTDGTFLATYRAEFGDGKSNAEILALKNNVDVQERLMDRLTRDNASALEKAGVPVTEGNLYLAHFAGQYGAVKVLKANPDAPIESVLGESVVKANPFLRGKSAADVAKWAASKMGESNPVTFTQAESQLPEWSDPYAKALDDYRQGETAQQETQQADTLFDYQAEEAPQTTSEQPVERAEPVPPVVEPIEPVEPQRAPERQEIPIQANESPIVTPEATEADSSPRLPVADTGGALQDAGGAPVEPLPDVVRGSAEPLVEADAAVVETNRLSAIVRNADDATVQRINAALPDGVELKQRQDGGYSVPKRYEATVRDAVAVPTEDFTQPRAVPELNDRSGSWVVVDRQTGEQVFETFERDTAERVNRDRYDVLTAAEYLGQFNQRVREAGGSQPEGSTYAPLPREQRGGDLGPPAVRNEPRPPIRTAPPIEGTETRDTAVTTTGREIPVEYAVVDLNSLVTSHTTGGAVNPDFPAELQPRDRSRGTSQAQITEIASRLDPRLLGRTVKASDGAPIISPEGIVESGNGRTLAIAEAYRRGGERADAYRDFVQQQGFDTTGIEQPVLVRVRDAALPPEDVQAFTREANQRDTAGFSATEQAATDAESLSADVLSLYRGGDIDAAGNRDFVRRFMETVPTTERANMVANDGAISQDAIRRINAALVQKAYGNAQLVAKLNEASDNNIKAIGGALVDVAGQWSQMAEAARNGQIDPAMDITPNLNEAVELVDRARREGKNVADLVNQTDIFSGETVDPRTEAALRLMFHNTTKFIKPVSRSKLGEGLSFFADQAMLTSSGADLLGVETKATPEAVLTRAREKFIEGQTAEQGGLFAGPGDAGVLGDVRQDGGNRDGAGESISQESRVESRDGAAQAEKLRVTRAPQIDPAKLQARLTELQLDDKVNLAVTDLINGNPRIAGSYRNRLIKVAMQANQDAETTLNHEVVHAMKEMGLFRDAEWKALARNADIDSVRNRYQGLDEAALTEEAIADRYMKWVQGQKETGFVQKAFERIREALRAIGQVFRGEGFTTAESVFRAMDSGKVGAREAGPLSINERVDGPRYSIVDQTQSDAFKRWAGTDNIIEPGSVNNTDFRAPGPYVIRAYHGTTHSFDAFNASKRGNAEGQFGKVNYFTTSESDADINYSGEGPDLTGRIETLAERIDANEDVGMDQARVMAREQLAGSDNQVLEVFIRTDNPFVIDEGRSPYFEGQDFAAIEQEAIQRVADDEGVSTEEIEANREDYEDAIHEARWEIESDTPDKLFEAIDAVAARSGFDAQEVYASMADRVMDGIRHDELEAVLRSNEELAYAEDDEGNLNGYQALGEIIQELGFDSIILKNANDRFSAMTMDYGTAHIHVFDANNTNIKSATDNIGTFDPNDPRIRYSLTDAPFERTIDEETAQPVRTITQAANNGTPMEKVNDLIDWWRIRLQDKMIPVSRLQDGMSVNDGTDAYQGEEIMSGRAGARLERLADTIVDPLFQAMHESKVSVDELETYLYARHAQERNAQIAKINPEFREGEGSGMTDIQARAILSRIDKAGQTETMEALAGFVDRMNREAVDTRVAAGLLSREEADAWQEIYKHYVPLRGQAETGASGKVADRIRSQSGASVKGRESRRAFGRKSQADNILAYSILQAEEAIVRSEKNRVAQQFYRLAKENPDPNLWTINKVETKRRANPSTGMVENYTVNQLTAEDADYTVTAKVDGKEYRVTMNKDNPDAARIATAMRNLDGPEFNMFIEAASKFNRYFSAINTRYNPSFVVTNAIRDIQTMAVVSQQYEAEMPGFTKRVMSSYPKAMFATKDGSGEWAQARRDWELAGGKVYYNQTKDLAELRADIEKRTKRLSNPNLVAKAWVKTFDTLEALNEGVERAIRLSVYKTARDMGKSRDQAASMSRNVTVNFTRKGQWGPFLNSFYAFFNASVQGNANLIRAAAKSSRVRKGMAGFIVMGFLHDVLNSMIAGDDDDGQSYWDKVPKWEKERNLILMVGENGEAVKIPLAYGLNALFAIGRNASAVMRGAMSPGEAAAETALTFADAFNPVGGGGSWLNVIAPTIADIGVDIAENKDFTGKPIQPEQNPFGPPVTPSSNYFPASVDPTAKAIAKGVNAATGGDDVVAGGISFSPESLSHIVGQLTGGAGRFVMDVSQIVGSAFDPEAEVTLRDIPIVKSVATTKSPWVDKSAYYERVREIEVVQDRAKQYQERGDTEALAAYVEANRETGSMIPVMKAAEKEMRAIRKDRNAIYFAHELGRMDDDAFRTALDQISERENYVVQQFNRIWIDTTED